MQPTLAGRISLIALLTVLYCVSAAAQDQYGTVYLYRNRETPPNGYSSEAVVYIDGEELLAMPERSFIGFRVPVGQYLLTMSTKGLRRAINVEADKVYYIRISQTSGNYAHQMIYGADEKTALEAIRVCDAIKEKKVKLSRFEIIRVNPNKKKH
jgi:hypothetical protein